jgi:hypothetical protein
VSELTPAVEERPGVGNYGSHVQRDDEMPVFSRIVAVDVAIDEERRNLVSLLEIIVGNKDPVEKPELAELLVSEAEFLLNRCHDA